nr:MAG TPA: hypothetical protein [Caudoviricetes sp.]
MSFVILSIVTNVNVHDLSYRSTSTYCKCSYCYLNC